MTTLNKLIVTAEEAGSSEDEPERVYAFAALELPSGECVVPHTQTHDEWFASRDEIEASGLAHVVSVAKTGETADWSDEEIANSVSGSASEFGREAIPESLRALVAEVE